MTIASMKTLPMLAAVALLVAGCASPNVNPTQARVNTGYVDFYAEPAADLMWDVAGFNDGTGAFQRVFSEFKPPASGVLRLAFAPGPRRLRVTFLNLTTTKPAEVDIEVQDGQITPVRITLAEEGTASVKTKETSRGGTAYGRYGRRTKIGLDETVTYGLSAVADPPVAYQTKERMSYAR